MSSDVTKATHTRHSQSTAMSIECFAGQICPFSVHSELVAYQTAKPVTNRPRQANEVFYGTDVV